MSSNHKSYALLDGVRGIAALFVLTRHTQVFWGGIQFYRSYLAVDLFFGMSGFVIGLAYDEKIRSKKMPTRIFILMRPLPL